LDATLTIVYGTDGPTFLLAEEKDSSSTVSAEEELAEEKDSSSTVSTEEEEDSSGLMLPITCSEQDSDWSYTLPEIFAKD
jgi:hypothetical protein